MKIHHATKAKAVKFRITLTVEDNEVVATSKDGVRLAAGLQGNKVLEDAITKLTGKPAKGTPEGKTAAKVAPKPVKAKKRKAKVSMVDADEAGEEPSDEGLDDDSDADQGKSIVKAKYKAKYKPTKDKSGDELSFRVHDHVSREDDAGELKINLDALRTFAKANECWVPSYASLKSRTGAWNGGMAVMNCNNRLRARLRRIAKELERPFDVDKDIVWD